MPNTLTRGVTVLTLPDDLLWPDEYEWQAVEQRTQYTITGALIVEASAKQAGRAITLQGGVDYAWIERTALETLRTWAGYAAETFVLSYRGASFDVAFDHPRGAIAAAAVIDYCDPEGTDYYAVTLRFIEV
jgi:hypothetical protein